MKKKKSNNTIIKAEVKCHECLKIIRGISEKQAEASLRLHKKQSNRHKDVVRVLKEMEELGMIIIKDRPSKMLKG